MMYGRHETTPQNCEKNSSIVTKMNGFKIRFRENCFSLSLTVSVCPHSTNCLAHFSHVLEMSLYFCKFSYSSNTDSGDTQPRSHCSDFNAFSFFRFEINQIGVSGTYKWKYINRSSLSFDWLKLIAYQSHSKKHTDRYDSTD